MAFNPYLPSFFFNVETKGEGRTTIDPRMSEIRTELDKLGIENRPDYWKAYWKMMSDMREYKAEHREEYALYAADKRAMLSML